MNSLDLFEFYAKRPEADRLKRGIGQLESARTRELLERFLPPAPATVYDVGGGTGHYAHWLAERGYVVHLIDPVREHVSRAETDGPGLAGAIVGDARDLPWDDESADATLLMGPLYHLTEQADRLRALRESKRVLCKEGLLFATVIPRWASTFVGMLEGWIENADYVAMVRREIASGSHRRPDSWPNLFVDGCFHDREQVADELSAVGFELLGDFAIEGPAWMWPEFDAAWVNPVRREAILALSRLAERAHEVWGASPHVAILARRK